MTQSSRPQADNQSNGYIDSGPYSRNQWSQKLVIEWVGDAVTTRGPFAKYLNALEVTNSVGITMRCASGAGYCNGSLFDNTANVDITPGIPGIASRTDKFVMVENNTNADYDGTATGVILDFPAVLTDYELTASVPPYTCRLAILRGDAGTGAPTALIQTASHYMIELFRYNITNAPAINTITDNRDYVDAETKTLFLQPQGAWNITDVAEIPPTRNGTAGMMFTLTDTKNCALYGRLALPADYIEAMTVNGVVYDAVGAGGNIYAFNRGFYGACGDSYAARTTVSTGGAEAIGAIGTYSCHAEMTITTALNGDIMLLEFFRDATDVLDTLGRDVDGVGFLIEYLGYR